MSYQDFLARKSSIDVPVGIKEVPDLNDMIFPFQKACVSFALTRGRAALFEDCGLGKTFQQLEWARVVSECVGRVIILAPLAVAQQTIREAHRLGINGIKYCRSQADVSTPITITNYEMLHHFDAGTFKGVVLDESSILKNFTGKIRTSIIEAFHRTPFRLSCTATPAPNDFMELGNQAEFLGVMSRNEMLAMYFTHDGGDTSQWRLKGHAEGKFWKWVSTWAVCVRKPSDIGYSDEGYELPELRMHQHILDAQSTPGFLIAMPAMNLTDQRAAKKAGVAQRVELCAEMANADKSPWVVWGELNTECDDLESRIPDAVQVAGSDKLEDKESRLEGFASGKHRVIVSKPSIAGFGLNWQHCNKMAFVNLSHSFEDQYQAIRRCWRFGQKKPVDVHIYLLESEIAILENVQRKQREADEMAGQMVQYMQESMKSFGAGTVRQKTEYKPSKTLEMPEWMKQSTNKRAKAGRQLTETVAK